MTGPEHYREAERLLNAAQDLSAELPADVVPSAEHYLALSTTASLANAHAVLALAAATAIPNTGQMPVPDCDAWEAVAGSEAAIAAALAAGDDEHAAHILGGKS